MPSSNFADGKVDDTFNSDYMWRNRNFHLNASESLDGVASKTLVWYAMPGPWNNAIAFAQSLQ
jgi:hypothetical protein